MSPSFAKIAPTYDALRPLSAVDRARLEAMLREAAVGAEDLVIEVGCGTGRLTLPLAALTPARVMGVDTEARMLDVARAKDVAGRVQWVRGSARLRDHSGQQWHQVHPLAAEGPEPVQETLGGLTLRIGMSPVEPADVQLAWIFSRL